MKATIFLKSGQNTTCENLKEILCYLKTTKIFQFPNESNFLESARILKTFDEFQQILFLPTGQYTFVGDQTIITLLGDEILYLNITK